MSDLDRLENEGGQVPRPRLAARLVALRRRHEKLDTLLDAELGRPKPCDIELQRLRREKLYLKDEMRTLVL